MTCFRLKSLFFKSLTLLALISIAGCNPFSAPQSTMDEYVERVARVLEQDVTLSEVPLADLFPRRRDRRLEMPDLELGMLDFLSLYGCDLQFVVGERNSSLGRVMQPVNILRYELRFIEAAEDCLPELEDDEELHEAVAKARKAKIGSLPIAIWNATWGIEEIEPLFTRTEGLLPMETSGATVSDLERDLALLNTRLTDLGEGNLDVDLAFLGGIQQRWQAEARMGQLIKSALHLVIRLNDAADIMQQRLDSRPLCLKQRTNNQAEIAKNMFFSVYAGEVQPYMATVDRVRDALVPGFERLAASQRDVMPESFEPYYRRYLQQTGESSLWQQLDDAVARHTRLWQELLGQCGFRPGS
ncbi:DUF3080 domain-containing protein [Marinobacter nanhaiticus D15-8W]|uniref:DUF3080 domain-containing protein n=2 Tax=Marinobacter TaxID=2742 RepID=N6VW83_9GAMM|nr:DUF3080 domain-containing protein [Marinobacter nanhaiticus D15-8W]BES71889.1 DUF3080 domain-containing protein [Marinobacter nanhaiticus D15-8W]